MIRLLFCQYLGSSFQCGKENFPPTYIESDILWGPSLCEMILDWLPTEKCDIINISYLILIKNYPEVLETLFDNRY